MQLYEIERLWLTNLPVIIGFGGINAAGRSSSHHSYRRLIVDHLGQQDRQDMLTGLATLTGNAQFQDGKYLRTDTNELLSASKLSKQLGQQMLDSTLIRRIGTTAYDIDQLVLNKAALLRVADGHPR